MNTITLNREKASKLAFFRWIKEKKLKLVCLNSNFYNKYLEKEEILKKQNRPYVIFVVNINNIDWAIPFRSNIRHKYAYMTDKINNNGID